MKLVNDPGVVLVDMREGGELHMTGKVRGTVHVARGFLEFHADPTSPSRKAELGGGRKLVLYCGSDSRSALGAESLEEIGIENVAHVAGRFCALKQAGAAIQNGEASWRLRAGAAPLTVSS